ncbi:MAG: type I glyceraldehyde-3-phosphate dehydrogenase [Acidobacteriota bacterium]
MSLRVGLMGFGRIGRNIFRQVADREEFHVAAISDLGEPDSLAYLLAYDTIYGRFPGSVSLEGKTLVAGRQRARLLRGMRPQEMPWDAYGIDVVVEGTHQYRRRQDLEGHLESGARWVILSTPALDEIDRTIVHGLNHEDLRPSDRIISCASATTHVLGLLLKILHGAVGVRRAMMTSVHAYTSDQKLSDAVATNLRRSRSAAENLIPNWSWSPEVVEKLMPELAGRIGGMAINVPVPNGSNLDLVIQIKEKRTAAEVNEIIRQASQGPYADWLEFATDPLVSSDVVGNRHSGIFDSLATMAMDGGLTKMITWYDNGWGYAARIVETMEMIRGFCIAGNPA